MTDRAIENPARYSNCMNDDIHSRIGTVNHIVDKGINRGRKGPFKGTLFSIGMRGLP